MRKNAKYILATLLLLCVTTSVNAEECDYAKQVELNNEASTVKAIYEETEIDTGKYTYAVVEGTDRDDLSKQIPITYKGFKIKIINITENIYASVENDNGTKYDYYYKDSNNGVIELESFKADQVRNYKITIRANGGECSGKELRSIALIVPRYNDFSKFSACDDYPDFQYCQKYTTDLEEISLIEFQQELEEYKKNNNSKAIEKEKNKNEKNSKNKILDFAKENMIIIIVIIVVVGVATSVIIIRKRSRLI